MISNYLFFLYLNPIERDEATKVMEFLGESANYWNEGLLRYNFYDNVTGLVSLSQVFRGGF
jgi:hypothetical protein